MTRWLKALSNSKHRFRRTRPISSDCSHRRATADGQMKALMAANQLAALQQEQLLQIRALLVAEQQALAARNATLANDEAMREAATKQFFNVP